MGENLLWKLGSHLQKLASHALVPVCQWSEPPVSTYPTTLLHQDISRAGLVNVAEHH